MAIEDKIKWNNKYLQNEKLLKKRVHSKRLEKALKFTNGEKALEIACGTGRNSLFLATHGFCIDAFDISDIAIEFLKNENIKNINAQLIDLQDYKFLDNHYDLIVQTNFFDREILPKLKNSLKKGGIIFIETYMDDITNEKTPSNPSFLLQKNELKTIFENGFKVLEYIEEQNDADEMYKMMKQSVIAKKL